MDVCMCLTAQGPLLHVVALNVVSGKFVLDRPLKAQERGALQGFPFHVCLGIAEVSNADAVRIFGNAMSVPVVGAVLGTMLGSFLRAWGTGVRDVLETASGVHNVLDSSSGAPTVVAGCAVDATTSAGSARRLVLERPVSPQQPTLRALPTASARLSRQPELRTLSEWFLVKDRVHT